MELCGKRHATVILPPGTHWTGDWVGPRADLDVSEETNIYCPHREPKRHPHPIL